ncbi:MAG: glycosyltransferase family 4 protein [Pseudanabaena sp. Salubria-1]|jgi:glycogen(starch) synthase|nr:glycosyltransferase family 4 protein [Pseudanabaena sp. Salubria-1]
MRILIYSPSFYPNIGGLESIISTLAHEFVAQGHEVKLVSQTLATDSHQFPFEVIRCPNNQQLLQLANWCEVYFQGCVSLKGLWPIFLVHRPLVITHQTWYRRNDGKESWQDHLKKLVTRFATNISISQAIAKELPTASTIIPNAYREDVFCEMPEVDRNRELVFLGRLVSDKGANLLLDALVQLKLAGLFPKLTIIGSGEEEYRLRQQVINNELDQQVIFVGIKVGQDLSKLLNSHQILVVPSLWKEPFGIVALEGIACGCVVVGSDGGGLKDAIGSCGVTFPNGNTQALTQILRNLLQNPDQLITYKTKALEHLLRHQKTAIAKAYLEVIKTAVESSK